MTNTSSAASRQGNRSACASCGKVLSPKRGARRQQFCTSACRQSAHRAKKWGASYQTPDPLRSVENTTTNTTACEGDFAGRAPANKPAADPDRAQLIRNAYAVEFAARWSVYGKR
jgi:hypothetical protein